MRGDTGPDDGLAPGHGAIDAADRGFEALLEYLRQSHGFDFTGYRRSTLMRRVARRLEPVDIHDFDTYLEYLRMHPEEFGLLFDCILINVTAFYRDPAAWDVLRRVVVPALLGSKHDGQPIRVWSAGCASGEEAYTLAIVLAEEMGLEPFHRRVKIYATDVDEGALQRARLGTYELEDVGTVPDALRERYFDVDGAHATVRGDLRRSIIFGRHDVVQDPPIPRLDLLVARNMLMYLTADTQARVIEQFHDALSDGGFLFLGSAEMPLGHTGLFAAVDAGHRLFARAPGPGLRDPVRDDDPRPATSPAQENGLHASRLGELAIDAAPSAQMVVDAAGVVTAVNAAARSLLGLAGRDVGRRFDELAATFPPLDLRSLVALAQVEGRASHVAAVDRRAEPGRVQWLDIDVTPLYDAGDCIGTSVTFVDVTSSESLQAELSRTREELGAVCAELQSTNEELETANEELQATVEELETTNEELQSANEELETMNEELQSTNGDLQTINVELRDRGSELDRINVFMESVFAGLRVGVAVLDGDGVVRVWNRRAQDMWGPPGADVAGQAFLALDIGLPMSELEGPIGRCLAGEDTGEEMTVMALDRGGRAFPCRVTCAAMTGHRGSPDGVVLLFEDAGAGAPVTA